jgi:predicted dehydrogenase
MNKRDFLKKSSLGAVGIALAPSFVMGKTGPHARLRTAHIGVGNMGGEDLKAISSHSLVDVTALCDVDTNNLAAAKKLHPDAKTFSDYRLMLKEMGDDIDAVIVSTPDHTHAPASMMAMQLNKPVYCQKPLTHYVSEARAMKKLAAEKNLVTQMGIQVHSFYDYKLATLLIQSGIIGKVHTVRAWSPKNWGFDGTTPEGSDTVPPTLDWNLWLGTSIERPYKEGVYHPGNWRKLMDYGCGTLGDMGVHIFDTPYNALELDVPRTIKNECRKPTGFGYPEKNTVTYEFPGTKHTAKTLKWVWYDGPGAPEAHEDLKLPGGEALHDQGAMFMGEKGRLYLPHFQKLPQLIVDGKYKEMDIESFKLGAPVRDYESEGKKHYHQFVDACLGNAECSAPFEYASRLTETILLGVIAGRFPNQTLHWDSSSAKFSEEEANQYLEGAYREF